MTRARGELPPEEERLLGIERPSIEDEQDQAKAFEERKMLRKAVLMHAFQQDEFRVWLMEKLQSFGTFVMPAGMSPNGSPDPQATFFNLGMKAAGWALWEEFDDLSPELASKMRREAQGKA